MAAVQRNEMNRRQRLGGIAVTAFLLALSVAVVLDAQTPAAGQALKPAAGPPAQKSPGAGPVVVLETVKGTIEFETYPEDAPKTVARVLELVKKNFYNGQRFHRAEPNFVVQIGDPTSRDMSQEAWWGRSPRSGTGVPIGVSEITKKRRHLVGSVGMAHAGDAKMADSQFYIVIQPRPGLDGKYTVFGHVISGMEVVQKIKKTDILKRAYVKP
jgi:cyclophilin family peptidyl-prolyl cis-trans isomerase